MAIVALITDFGTSDWFVGEMKGAMLSIAPTLFIVDVTHHIAPGDIASGAFALLASYRSFPPGTIFCAVVDPGVGSGRFALAARSDRYFFVGPDNGILSKALDNEESCTIENSPQQSCEESSIRKVARITYDFSRLPRSRASRNALVMRVHRIENRSLLAVSASATFHGRDLFGPAAAHLASGNPIQDLGPETKEYVRTAWIAPKLKNGCITGAIIYFDHFGNAITNIDTATLKNLGHAPEYVYISRHDALLRFVSHFDAVAQGQGLGYEGSAGFAEIGINQGNARERYALALGDEIEIR